MVAERDIVDKLKSRPTYCTSRYLVALGFRAGQQTVQDAAQWAGLWFFTVAAPTVQALRIHRRLNDIVQESPTTSAQIRRDLAHARFVILMCGTMCVLVVFSLQVVK